MRINNKYAFIYIYYFKIFKLYFVNNAFIFINFFMNKIFVIPHAAFQVHVSGIMAVAYLVLRGLQIYRLYMDWPQATPHWSERYSSRTQLE